MGLLRRLVGRRWASGAGFRKREYRSYADYEEHQKSKLAKLKDLDRKRAILKTALRGRLKDVPQIRRGINVLCLGARSGAECEAFMEHGAFAVGIDLNPGEANRFVVTGDFHDVQFADASIDCIYTNALDHVFDMDRVLAEMHRLLKPGGILIADIVRGSQDPGGREPGDYESCWWDSSDHVVRKIAERLKPLSRRDFSEPWNGEQAVFER